MSEFAPNNIRNRLVAGALAGSLILSACGGTEEGQTMATPQEQAQDQPDQPIGLRNPNNPNEIIADVDGDGELDKITLGGGEEQSSETKKSNMTSTETATNVEAVFEGREFFELPFEQDSIPAWLAFNDVFGGDEEPEIIGYWDGYFIQVSGPDSNKQAFIHHKPIVYNDDYANGFQIVSPNFLPGGDEDNAQFAAYGERVALYDETSPDGMGIGVIKNRGREDNTYITNKSVSDFTSITANRLSTNISEINKPSEVIFTDVSTGEQIDSYYRIIQIEDGGNHEAVMRQVSEIASQLGSTVIITEETSDELLADVYSRR